MSTIMRDEPALRRHYEVERELADRLRSATAAERRTLYRTVYNELFRRVPDHPQLSRKRDADAQADAAGRQLRLLRRFLGHDTVYLEVGAGDCHFAMMVARSVGRVYAVDVSDEIAGGPHPPDNFSLVLSDGTSIDVPPDSVDVAYSYQVIEHLHPEDAAEQLRAIYAALAPGGVYVCTTPHRYSGPQDISRYFDTEASGFHLKEYTYRELRALFREVGFERTASYAGIKQRYFRLPEPSVLGLERSLSALPGALRKRLARSAPLRPWFDSVTIVGQKRALRAAGKCR